MQGPMIKKAWRDILIGSGEVAQTLIIFFGQGEKINLKNCLKKFEKLIKKINKKKIVKRI